MVKYRSQKPRKFGMAGGVHCKTRKTIYKHKHQYRMKSKKKSGSKLNKLKIYRINTLRKYNITKYRKSFVDRKLFNCGNKQLFTIKRVSADSPFKFSISRVSSLSVDGYRLIDLNILQKQFNDISMHVAVCKKAQLLVEKNISPIKLETEVKTLGLASVLRSVCQGCNHNFIFETSTQLDNKKANSSHFDVNVRAVWGSMVTGGGVSHLNELMATLNGPGLSQQTYGKIEQEIGDMWGDVVNEELLAAGAEERRIAMEKGSYHDGVPCITVVCDGGWSKRSHKHSYNALGGVGIIIGAETGKLLHIGIRNKHCYICSQAESKHITPKPHRCFRNWNDSSQAMESDIILEGFLKAESTHGLRYTKIIADGDSSVFAKIQECVPVWGKSVSKIECANHVCKCLRSSLEKLVAENPLYKGKNKLSKSLRVRLTSAVRCAIRIRSKESDKKKATKLMEHDIRTSIYHILGQHKRCSDFCKAKNNNKVTSVNEGNEEIEVENDDIPDILEGLSNIWSETTSIEAEEESRGDAPYVTSIDDMMMRDVNILLDRVASKSQRLIGNSTTNLAESWMAIRSKFDGGKLYNRCNRGSWHSRCFGGSLRKNIGPQWSPSVWQKVTSTTPGVFFDRLYQRRDDALSACKSCKEKPESKAKRWKRKYQADKESSSKKARLEYGPNAVDSIPDFTETQLEDKKKHFLEKHINLSEEKLKVIEISTKNQSISAIWLDERKKRLTASNFSSVVNRNPSIKVTKLVQSMLYSKFKGNIHTHRGIQEEAMTIKEYISMKMQQKKNVQVYKMGLTICRENKFLAASPDGKVIENGQEGLIEIKNLLHTKPIDLIEATTEVNNFCLEFTNNQLHLKKKHPYYFQIQGQLNITKLPWLDFIVRTVNPYHIHIERIKPDCDLWTNIMVPKLRAFYFKALLPELAAPRNNTITGIREPGVWYENKSSNVTTKKPIKKSKANTGKKTQSTYTDPSPGTSSSTTSTSCTRSRRNNKVKFVGRRISHEWMEDESSGTKKWYSGTVLGTLSGRDGDQSCVYEVLYDGESEPYSIDHIVEDYNSSSVKFIDI